MANETGILQRCENIVMWSRGTIEGYYREHAELDITWLKGKLTDWKVSDLADSYDLAIVYLINTAIQKAERAFAEGQV